MWPSDASPCATASFWQVTLPADDAADRLAFAVRWLLLPGLTLLAGVIGAGRRGFYRDAIEGTCAPTSYSLEINLRHNQNTFERTVLAANAWIGLLLALPHDRLVLIPVMAMLFAFGRAAFWIGYLLHPPGARVSNGADPSADPRRRRLACMAVGGVEAGEGARLPNSRR